MKAPSLRVYVERLPDEVRGRNLLEGSFGTAGRCGETHAKRAPILGGLRWALSEGYCCVISNGEPAVCPEVEVGSPGPRSTSQGSRRSPAVTR